MAITPVEYATSCFTACFESIPEAALRSPFLTEAASRCAELMSRDRRGNDIYFQNKRLCLCQMCDLGLCKRQMNMCTGVFLRVKLIMPDNMLVPLSCQNTSDPSDLLDVTGTSVDCVFHWNHLSECSACGIVVVYRPNQCLESFLSIFLRGVGVLSFWCPSFHQGLLVACSGWVMNGTNLSFEASNWK